MSHSSPEASSDGGGDAEPTHSRVTRARRSSPNAGYGVAPHAVPRVIRTAAAAAVSPYTRPSYSPKLSVDMASAHSWAPYPAAIRALRSLSLMSLKVVRSREEARETIAELYSHAAPFGAARRFPEGEVYVCLDRAPFARRMQGIQQPLNKAEAAEWGKELVSACSSYISGIGDALDELTRVDDDRVAPVLYDRAVFESAFHLTWTER